MNYFRWLFGKCCGLSWPYASYFLQLYHRVIHKLIGPSYGGSFGMHIVHDNSVALYFHSMQQNILSYDVASGSQITPCNKIDKPLDVYRL